MATARINPYRASGSGWNTETHYSPKVLIGNWQEERLVNEKQYYRPVSSYSIDFKGYRGACPDVIVRRNAELTGSGLPKEILFGHGTDYQRKGDMITWYDEHYSNRVRDESNKLPPLRQFSTRTLTWIPEKSDHPILGEPTNFGLHDKLRQQWADEIGQAVRGPAGGPSSYTTYRTSYVKWPRSVYATAKQQNARNAPVGARPESTVYRGNTTL